MKLRHLKKRAYRSLVFRCKAYDMWCYNCQQHRFLDLHGRFPYSYRELHDEVHINHDQQDKTSPYYDEATFAFYIPRRLSAKLNTQK